MGEMKRAIAHERRESQKMDRFASTVMIAAAIIAAVRLAREGDARYYEEFRLIAGKRSLVIPRRDPECPECSHIGTRYARGETIALPCIEG